MNIRLLAVLLLTTSTALARDPITGIEDSHDTQIANIAAQSGKKCTIPHIRYANGKSYQVRNRQEMSKFRYHFPCPSTEKRSGACPGWVVDYIQALKHCGADVSTNMAWMTVDDAKLKDKWE